MGAPSRCGYAEGSAVGRTSRRRRLHPAHGSSAQQSQERSFDTTEKSEAASSGVITARATHKRRRKEPVNPFDALCDDLIVSILARLSSGSCSPAHLISVALTCKRFRGLAMQKSVLACASKQAMAVRASAWCKDAENFFKLCADSGNLEACFTLGMIKFYCMGERREGVQLLAKAAKAWHGGALFALAIIHSNGSGGKASDRNMSAGVALCVRSALAGNVEALRELGYCFKEGQGLPRNAEAGRQLLLEANRKEAVSFVRSPCRSCAGAGSSGAAGCVEKGSSVLCCADGHRAHRLAMYKELLRRSLRSDYGCAFPLRWLLQHAHPVHSFMVEWFTMHAPLGWGMLRVCSNALCGRPETRPLEFRQCGVCSSAFYCSRSCQSMDWKLQHMLLCQPVLPSLI